MQLKDLAKVSATQKTFNDIVATGNINNLAFKKILAGLNAQEKINIVSQSALNQTQKIGALASADLTSEELKATIQTGILDEAQKAASASTLGLGEAFKGLGMKIKSLVTAHPVLTGIAVGITAIAAAYKVWDVLTVTLKEQKEKLEDVKKSYEGVKEELQDISDEIQNTKNAIDELESKSNLSWVEKEELDRLREVTKELELQKQLKEDEQVTAAGKLYKENVKSFNKEFESSYGTSSISELISRLSSGDIGIGQLDTDDNVTDMIAALQYLNEEKEKLTDEETIAEYGMFITILKLEVHILNMKCILLKYMKLLHPPIRIRLLKNPASLLHDRLHKRAGLRLFPASSSGFSKYSDKGNVKRRNRPIFAIVAQTELSGTSCPEIAVFLNGISRKSHFPTQVNCRKPALLHNLPSKVKRIPFNKQIVK